ncbi:hypothetical protein HMPREF1544_00164 [Mucor circinelloides 1006PhL]|uniref:Uncharacterized protein n=1 Tax=Mucor circinelloides f. circinelloides (strain 1006PhL) TaxID=1220926 RepID=S2KL02_MUCC1|nr:hypothetical protein HMPREF1544_00164 [Mucor circinelloides 1006PhL]
MQGKTNCRQTSKRIRNLIRPDFIVQQQENISWGPPVVIGEIKGDDAKDDLHASLLDLIRIGHISKKIIDIHHCDGVIGVHVVGNLVFPLNSYLKLIVNTTVSIYIISLVSPGFYIMLEVCSFVIPRDLTQLRSFLAVAEDLLPIKKLYNDHCRKPDSGLSISNIRAGLLDAA